MDDDYERILSVKNEVFVYKIPPRSSSRGYRAADWKLDAPDWTGRMRIVVLNSQCIVKLEDKTSGELFAQAPISQYPGPSVESVSDSSRYFVLKIVDVSGRHAFIGIGFADRGDSFDFNVSLQDHFKREKVEEKVTSEPVSPPLDLSFKEGETIKINIGSRANQDSKSRPKKSPAGSGLLPPPPGGGIPKIAPISNVSNTVKTDATVPSLPAQQNQSEADWGDFASFPVTSSSTQSTGWVQF